MLPGGHSYDRTNHCYATMTTVHLYAAQAAPSYPNWGCWSSEWAKWSTLGALSGRRVGPKWVKVLWGLLSSCHGRPGLFHSVHTGHCVPYLHTWSSGSGICLPVAG